MLGLPVTESEFFGRAALMKDLKKTIPHAHHALIGPRGCGKSSILQQLAETGDVNGFTPVYIDVGRVVPKTHRNVLKKIGREVLYGVVKQKGIFKSLPVLAKDKMAKVSDFVRDNLRVKISDWVTLYFDPDADLTEFMEATFSTIESYGVELLVMLDEITSLVRLSGPQPREDDMDFMEALRGHISDAKHTHYILSGSQVGLMNLIVKLKFGRMLVPKKVEELDEAGADELIRAKLGCQVSSEFVAEIKRRTLMWPLYIQAFCLATNLNGKKPDSPDDTEKTAFDLLSGHFLYLESQLSEHELMTLLVLNGEKVSDVAARLEIPYNTLQSVMRTLELKGFVKKTSPGTYESIDPMLSKWLRQRYEAPEEWK